MQNRGHKYISDIYVMINRFQYVLNDIRVTINPIGIHVHALHFATYAGGGVSDEGGGVEVANWSYFRFDDINKDKVHVFSKTSWMSWIHPVPYNPWNIIEICDLISGTHSTERTCNYINTAVGYAGRSYFARNPKLIRSVEIVAHMRSIIWYNWNQSYKNNVKQYPYVFISSKWNSYYLDVH